MVKEIEELKNVCWKIFNLYCISNVNLHCSHKKYVQGCTYLQKVYNVFILYNINL